MPSLTRQGVPEYPSLRSRFTPARADLLVRCTSTGPRTQVYARPAYANEGKKGGNCRPGLGNASPASGPSQPLPPSCLSAVCEPAARTAYQTPRFLSLLVLSSPAEQNCPSCPFVASSPPFPRGSRESRDFYLVSLLVVTFRARTYLAHRY